MKILIVDDEASIREVIKEYAINSNYEVIEACDGLDALNKINNSIDIIILDIMMPNMDGYTFYKEIKEKYQIPVIILSARNDEYDKLQGFDLGIDDYVTKPFSPKELMARIKAVTNRNKIDKDEYVYKSLKVDYLGRAVFIDDKEIKLTPKEYDLLCFFIQNKGIALSREILLSKVWGYDFYGDDRTIDTHIKMLRSNLGKYRDLVSTVRSVGYKYEEK